MGDQSVGGLRLGFFIALQFLTPLPSPFRRRFSTVELGQAQAFFPLVGLFLGVLLLLSDTMLSAVFPPSIVGALLAMILVILTGGLHVDGLIDCCDGLFVHRGPEDRLAIMRDSRAGSFGVIGGVSLLVLKYAGFVALGGTARPITLLLVPTIARWAMVYALATFPYARSQGKGVAFHGHGSRPFIVATAVAVIIALVLWPERGLLLFVAVAAWTTLAGRFMAARLGGLTGDCYGAIGETAEVLVLLGATIAWRGLS